MFKTYYHGWSFILQKELINYFCGCVTDELYFTTIYEKTFRTSGLICATSWSPLLMVVRNLFTASLWQVNVVSWEGTHQFGLLCCFPGDYDTNAYAWLVSDFESVFDLPIILLKNYLKRGTATTMQIATTPCWCIFRPRLTSLVLISSIAQFSSRPRPLHF